MRQVQVHGLKIVYDQHGDGPPLVLLHGFSHDARVWKPQMEGLHEYCSIIAWDAPGAGLSSDPAEPFSISDWSRCLAQFLDLFFG